MKYHTGPSSTINLKGFQELVLLNIFFTFYPGSYLE